jgi:hypothetical protein
MVLIKHAHTPALLAGWLPRLEYSGFGLLGCVPEYSAANVRLDLVSGLNYLKMGQNASFSDTYGLGWPSESMQLSRMAGSI